MCFTSFSRKPGDSQKLHALWDSSILEILVDNGSLTVGGLPPGKSLDGHDSWQSLQEWGTENLDLDQWVWKVHEVGERITYGELGRRIPDPSLRIPLLLTARPSPRRCVPFHIEIG